LIKKENLTVVGLKNSGSICNTRTILRHMFFVDENAVAGLKIGDKYEQNKKCI